MEFIVIFAVAVVFAEAVADFQDEAFGDSQVAVIKEGMNIGAQQNAVGDVVGAIHSIGLYVGGLEDGKRLFAADSAAALISIRYQDSKSALAKAVLCCAFGVP